MDERPLSWFLSARKETGDNIKVSPDRAVRCASTTWAYGDGMEIGVSGQGLVRLPIAGRTEPELPLHRAV
jgi:hypothetical protein